MEMDDEWWAMAKGHSFIYSIFFIVNEMNLKIEGKNEQSPALINTNGNDKREKKWMSWVNELPWIDELKNDIWLYYWLLSQIVEPIICYGDYNLL